MNGEGACNIDRWSRKAMPNIKWVASKQMIRHMEPEQPLHVLDILCPQQMSCHSPAGIGAGNGLQAVGQTLQGCA